MKINGFGRVEKGQLDDFEAHIGFELPFDYKEFLIKHNGGVPEVKYSTFFVKELNQKISLDVLLGFGIKELDLYEWNDEYKDDLSVRSIIIGHDPGVGMIILVNDKKMKGIYYWDDSHYFDQSNHESNSYKINDSFYEFLNGLTIPDELAYINTPKSKTMG